MVNVMPFVEKIMQVALPLCAFDTNYNRLVVTPVSAHLSTFQIYDVNTGFYFTNVNDWSTTKNAFLIENGCYPNTSTWSFCKDFWTTPSVTGSVITKYPVSPYSYDVTTLPILSEQYKEYSFPYIVGETADCLVTVTHLVHNTGLFEDIVIVKHCADAIGWIALSEK